jgi:hypothetical protein
MKQPVCRHGVADRLIDGHHRGRGKIRPCITVIARRQAGRSNPANQHRAYRWIAPASPVRNDGKSDCFPGEGWRAVSAERNKKPGEQLSLNSSPHDTAGRKLPLAASINEVAG